MYDISLELGRMDFNPAMRQLRTARSRWFCAITKLLASCMLAVHCTSTISVQPDSWKLLYCPELTLSQTSRHLKVANGA